jgi:hypothetical protein
MTEVYMDDKGQLFTFECREMDRFGNIWYPMTDDLGTVLITPHTIGFWTSLGEL